jgi:hypothetical protein
MHTVERECECVYSRQIGQIRVAEHDNHHAYKRVHDMCAS